MDVLNVVKEIGLVPVVVFKSTDEVDNVMTALIDGDVKIAEICFRTDCAEEAIKIASKKYPDVLVGAGTVINKEQCEAAIKAGAKFIVSPGTSDSVNDVCVKYGVPYFPGVVTPTEIMHALDLGITTLKFFPAGVFGGLKAIKALGAAFPQVKFMPTGGVDNSNLKEFITCDKIVACGGSWLLKGSHEEIVKTCLEARKIVKGE